MPILWHQWAFVNTDQKQQLGTISLDRRDCKYYFSFTYVHFLSFLEKPWHRQPGYKFFRSMTVDDKNLAMQHGTGLPDGRFRKILIWVTSWGTCNGRFWYAYFCPFGPSYSWPFGIFCFHLIYLWKFGIFPRFGMATLAYIETHHNFNLWYEVGGPYLETFPPKNCFYF
jgi:hypothetical protein